MLCKKCPHHVRHGTSKDNTIIFRDLCGLKMKRDEREKDCVHYPFGAGFDYLACDTYQNIFKSAGVRNDVVPTKDFQYLDIFNTSTITDFELL